MTENQEIADQQELTYRRGYWDGVYDALERLRKGETVDQVADWLWSDLSEWQPQYTRPWDREVSLGERWKERRWLRK